MKKISIQQKEDKECYEVGSVMFLSLKLKYFTSLSPTFQKFLHSYSSCKARMPLIEKRAAFWTEWTDDLWTCTVEIKRTNSRK